MAIEDRSLSLIQNKISKEFGLEILALNSLDQLHIFNTGYVTGSDVLNTDVWAEYRINNEIAANNKWEPREYLATLTKLGILADREIAEEVFKKKARTLKGATGAAAIPKTKQYEELFRARALFTVDADLKGTRAAFTSSTLPLEYDDLPSTVKTELDSKMIESGEILQIARPSGSADELGDTTYIRVKEGREIIARSMQAQGLKINRQNLRTKANARGTRGRFNVFNNNQEQHYASGSWNTNGGGPRIQGPAGGSGSVKFVIIHRSGSLG